MLNVHTSHIQLVQGVVNTYVEDFSAVLSSAQDGIYALGKSLMRSTPSLGSFPSVAFETVSMFV